MPNKIGEIDGSVIRQLEGESTFCYLSGAKVNADGAPTAYHPQKGKGLDYLANAGTPGCWWAIATDNGKATGNPTIQSSNEPAPGYYVCMTSLGDSKYKDTDQRRYVNSCEIPFIVLPAGKYFGARLGDLAMVCNIATGKYCGAIFADTGPPNKIGEISIDLAKELGVNPDPKTGGSDKSDFIYIVFPGSSIGWPKSKSEIMSAASKLFTNWGGFGKLSTFYPKRINSPAIPTNNISTSNSNISNNTNKAMPTLQNPVIAKLKVAVSTPLKIGPVLKPMKNLRRGEEYLVLSPGINDLDILEVINTNDQGHYRLKVIDPQGITRLAWVFNDDAAIEYVDIKSSESDDSMYLNLEPIQNLDQDFKEVVEKVIVEDFVEPIVAPVVKTIDPTNKKEIQREFARIGLLDGRKGFDDGKWGGLSESAKRAWLRYYGSPDGVLDEKALAALQQHIGYKDLDLKPKDPNKTSHVLATLCLKRMQELNMWLAVSLGSDSPAWNFFYLSGTNIEDGSFNKDAVDYMNDLRFLAKIAPDGTVEVGYISVATWDAGWKYRKDRMNSNGCFQIDYDKQFWSWRPGTHGVAAPHAALTQQDDGDLVTGTRDDDENGRTSTDKHYTDGGAVNHHGTVGRRPGQPIGAYSAGCGVDDDINAHLNIFMPKIKADRRVLASYGHLINCCFLKRENVKGLPLK